MNRKTGPDGSEVFLGDYEERLNSYIEGEEIGSVIEEFMVKYLGDVDVNTDFYRRSFDDQVLNNRGLIFLGEVLNEFRTIVENEYPDGAIETFLEGSAVNRRGFALLLMQMMYNAIQRSDDESRMALDSLMEGYVNKNSIPGAIAIRDKMLEMKESGQVYGLISCDADHFKGVNDDYNHAVGDAVLKHVSKTILGSVRDCFPVRAGGEELDLILDFNGNMDALLRVAERVRGAVANSPCYLKCKIDDNGAIVNFEVIDALEYQVINTVTGETRQRRGVETTINERREGSTMRTMFLMIPVSVSIGVDLIDGSSLNIREDADKDEVVAGYNEMKSVADAQCYLAKQNGRDRVFGRGVQHHGG